MPHRRWWLRLFGAGLVAACAAGSALAADNTALERSVKAAFMFKFLGYAEFPPASFADASSPVVIGVLGSEEMAAELGRIVAGRTVNNRPVAVRLLREGEPLTGVHMLFVAGTDNARAARALKMAQASPMLVVSECDNGLQLGSVINFTIIDERVRFDVSLDAADKNNVKLSSRLLTVANHVQKGAP